MALKRIILILGQSNGQGFGVRSQLGTDASVDTSVVYPHPTLGTYPCLYFDNAGEAIGTFLWGRFLGDRQDTVGVYGEESNYGPELSFVELYANANPTHELAVIKIAIGGTSIQDWTKPSGGVWVFFKGALDDAKALLTSAGHTYEFTACIWMQGESGWTSVYQSQTDPTFYRRECGQFFTDLRAETAANMPIVLGRIGNHMLVPAVITAYDDGVLDTPTNRLAAANHRRFEQEQLGAQANNAWISTDDLPVLTTATDDQSLWYHHTGPGYLAMGERFYAGYQTLTARRTKVRSIPALRKVRA